MFCKKNKNNHISGGEDLFIIQEGRFKLGKVKRSYRLDWTEEAYSAKKEGSEKIGKSFDFSALPKISCALAFLLTVIFFRIAWLQVAKGEYYYNLAEGNRIRVERVEAKRGIIYDVKRRPLVMNAANFLLYLTPIDLPESAEGKDAIYRRISEILGSIKSEDVKAAVERIKIGSLESYRPLFIADNIEYDKAILLNLESSNMPGVVLSNKTRREYNLYSLSLSHILGYTGKISEAELAESGDEYLPIDYIGKMGIENFWENELKGVNGKKQIEVDALGKEKKILNQEPSEDGHNLILSIDVELQRKIEEVLIDKLSKLKLNKASVIAINPNNGEIMAMVSFPSYDNNMFSRGITADEYRQIADNPDNPLFNRSISGEYPSGSTIKPIMSAAALEEGIISEHTTINSTGGIRVGQWFFPDWRAGGHGATDVKRAIAESINTFFYYIGGGYENFKGLGVDKIVQYEKLFGLNSQLGIDLPGEANGFLPSKEWKAKAKGESWYIGDTYHLSIGQGDLLVTPLQVACYTSVFANGGKLFRPHIVKYILSGGDRLIGEVKPEIIRENFINNYNLNIVRQGMRQTVTSGSARSLQSLPVAVAGKTGTAQNSTDRNHAWFIGFAPYDNPEIAITVLVEQGGEGSSVAVPIANEILAWYFNVLKAMDITL